MTYNAARRTYLMCVSRPADGFSSIGAYDTMLLEADAITGPWRLVQYLARFGEQAYFVNIPSKFIAPGGDRMWLCYSANFSHFIRGANAAPHPSRPAGSGYALCLQEFDLLPRQEPRSGR